MSAYPKSDHFHQKAFCRSYNFFIKFAKLSDGVHDLQTAVMEYKTQLSSLSLEPTVREAMSDYLLKIGQPILSVAQKEKAKGCARTPDYIGQYT